MVDPTSLGTIVANIIAIGAGAFAKGALSAASKDAYQAVRDAVVKKAGNETDIANLEVDPTSDGRQLVLAEFVGQQPHEWQSQIAELSKSLAGTLRSIETNPDRVGVLIGRLRAMEVSLDQINVSDGIGFAAREVEATQRFRVGEINVGDNKPGKR